MRSLLRIYLCVTASTALFVQKNVTQPAKIRDQHQVNLIDSGVEHIRLMADQPKIRFTTFNELGMNGAFN